MAARDYDEEWILGVETGLVNPTLGEVHRLADELEMTPVERRHLMNIAGYGDEPSRPPLYITDAERDRLNLLPWPAAMLSHCWDIVYVTDSYCDLFPGIWEHHNYVEWLVTDPRARTIVVDWHAEVRQIAGRVKFANGQHLDEPRYRQILQTCAPNSQFAHAWSAEEVRDGASTQTFLHVTGANNTVYSVLDTPLPDVLSTGRRAHLHVAKPVSTDEE
ncbi:hypothetical protein [Nocardia sp. NPDC051570]|uniref:MmyB family transcriptional regulator n=1 Tax=Nocardia sp. NPDC051570 TaxID=3364324 RepID=UPI00378F6F4E